MRYLIILLFPLSLFGQITETKIANQNAAIQLPKLEEGKKYPCFVFFQGVGETGTDWSKMYLAGMGKQMKAGKLKDYDAIFISIQQNPTWMLSPKMEELLQAIYKTYPVEYFGLTGLSAGASAIWGYMASKTSSLPIKYLVPMSYGTKSYATYNTTAFKGVSTWIFCGNKGDDQYYNTKALSEKIAKDGYSVKTTWYASGHCCWDTYYDPNYRENGLNIYEFMGAKVKSIVTQPPIVVPAPTPKTYKPGDTLKLKILEINDSVLILKTLY